MNITEKLKPAAIFTISMIGITSTLLFQAYYLYDTYRQHEKQVLQNIENVLSSSILKQEVKSLGKNNAVTNLENISKVNKQRNTSPEPNVKIVVIDKDSIPRQDRALNSRLRALSSKFGRVNDEELYQMISTAMHDKAFQFSLLVNNEFKTWTVPLLSPTRNVQVGPKATPIFNKDKTYTVLIHQFNWFVIQKMWLTILYSVIVSILSIGAITFLVTNLYSKSRLLSFKKSFMRNMAHELKTPLSTLLATSELLTSDIVLNDRGRIIKYISYLRTELFRLTDMVEDILTNSQLETHGIKLNKQYVNLNTVLRSAIHRHSSELISQTDQSDISSLYDQSGSAMTVLSLHTEINHDIYVQADPIHLGNAFGNLIENAIKYRSVDCPSLEINIQLDMQYVCIRFKDNGIGIAKEYQHNVFEAFFRVPDPNIELIKGYGLGLSYVKEIIEQHQGSISMNSNLPQGSIFIVKIPYAA